MAELGWLGLLTPPEHGGTGWDVVEACILAEETGRALSPVNWPGAALAAAALASSASTSALVPAIVAGRHRAVRDGWARGRRWDRAPVGELGPGWARRRNKHDRCRLSGEWPSRGFHRWFDTRGNARSPAFDTTRPTLRIGLGDTVAQLLDGDQLPWFVGVALLLSCADTLGALGRAIDTVTTI